MENLLGHALISITNSFLLTVIPTMKLESIRLFLLRNWTILNLQRKHIKIIPS